MNYYQLSWKKKLSALDQSNVVRRLATIDQQLAAGKADTLRLKAEVEELKLEVKSLSDNIIEKRRLTKNRTEQLRYHKLKRDTDQALSEEENYKLAQQLANLEKENDQLRLLRSDLDEIMGDQQITTFEDGRYAEDGTSLI